MCYAVYNGIRYIPATYEITVPINVDDLFTVEQPIVSLKINPSTPCVHPAFELLKAPKTLSAVELNDRPLAATDYAWDGHVLWLNATLRGETTVRLTFAE